jgi:phosphoribosyl-ATP pyrophosphohydrolase
MDAGWRRPSGHSISREHWILSNNVLERLVDTIRARRAASAGSSYTRQLLDSGAERCARKLGEEAVELVIAAVAQDDAAVKAETADVIYHLLVLLEARGVAFSDVLAVLEGRMGTSGIEEKASRSPGARP